MNIKELKDLVDAAFENGIDPNTEVVIDLSDGVQMDWSTIAEVIDPSAADQRHEEGYIWFTIRPTYEEADGRFTPGHYGYDD